LDLTTGDGRGRAWDFDQPESRERARRLVRRTRPLLLILSPMCRWFSVLQNLSKSRRDPVAFAENLKRAISHLEFCVELCRLQRDSGRYYLLEQPASATSWQPCILEFLAESSDAALCSGHQCMFGQTARTGLDQDVPVAKLTRWMTNSMCIAEALNVKCDRRHTHTHLLNDRASRAQQYPEELCKAIVKAFAHQLRLDGGKMVQRRGVKIHAQGA
jgi:hypothetical protein